MQTRAGLCLGLVLSVIATLGAGPCPEGVVGKNGAPGLIHYQSNLPPFHEQAEEVKQGYDKKVYNWHRANENLLRRESINSLNKFAPGVGMLSGHAYGERANPFDLRTLLTPEARAQFEQVSNGRKVDCIYLGGCSGSISNVPGKNMTYGLAAARVYNTPVIAMITDASHILRENDPNAVLHEIIYRNGESSYLSNRQVNLATRYGLIPLPPSEEAQILGRIEQSMAQNVRPNPGGLPAWRGGGAPGNAAPSGFSSALYNAGSNINPDMMFNGANVAMAGVNASIAGGSLVNDGTSTIMNSQGVGGVAGGSAVNAVGGTLAIGGAGATVFGGGMVLSGAGATGVGGTLMAGGGAVVSGAAPVAATAAAGFGLGYGLSAFTPIGDVIAFQLAGWYDLFTGNWSMPTQRAVVEDSVNSWSAWWHRDDRPPGADPNYNLDF